MEINNLIYGTGDTQGIVAVEATPWGDVTQYKREQNVVTKQSTFFKPFILLGPLSLLKGAEDGEDYEIEQLFGDNDLKHLVFIKKFKKLKKAILENYNAHHRCNESSLYRLKGCLYFPANTQYMIQTGETLFKGMNFNDLHRIQLDIETTGLDLNTEKIFMIQISDNRGFNLIIEGDEATILKRFVQTINQVDPDIIEGHNIFDFDLPFIIKRATVNGVHINVGRDGSAPQTYDGHVKIGGASKDFTNCRIFGRQVIDTLHAALQYNEVTKSLDSCALKEVAIHFKVASPDREYIPGDKIYDTYLVNPKKVRKYGLDDVHEVRGISYKLLQDKFALTKIVPSSYQAITTIGQVPKVEWPTIRFYILNKHSLPDKPECTEHYQGGDTRIFLTGVVCNIIKADVESLYPSTMLKLEAFPVKDTLGVFKAMLRFLLDERLRLKGLLKTCAPEDKESVDSQQLAYKILINSMYGTMGTAFSIFNDTPQAARVTEHGRKILSKIEEEGKKLGGILIESDTDGTYFSYEGDHNLFINKLNKAVGDDYIKIAHDGFWPKGLFLGKKNYALLADDGELELKGGSLKSRAISQKNRKLIKKITLNLLKNRILEIKKLCTEASAFNIDTSCTRTKMSKSFPEYVKTLKVKQPHIEALKEANIINNKKGDEILYYKTQQGWKLKNRYQSDHDEKYYHNQVRSVLGKFEPALGKENIKAILDPSISDSIIVNIKTTSTEVKGSVQKRWVELVHGIKLNKKDSTYKIKRKWFDLEDSEGIDSFVTKHKAIDVYASYYWYESEEKPKKGKKYAMYGDFVIEFEGTWENKEIAKKAMEEAKRIMDETYCFSHIHCYYNGGKSYYIKTPASTFIKQADLNLNDKYKALATDIKRRMSDGLKGTVDLQIYDRRRPLRIEGTVYPGGTKYVEL